MPTLRTLRLRVLPILLGLAVPLLLTACGGGKY